MDLWKAMESTGNVTVNGAGGLSVTRSGAVGSRE